MQIQILVFRPLPQQQDGSEKVCPAVWADTPTEGMNGMGMRKGAEKRWFRIFPHAHYFSWQCSSCDNHGGSDCSPIFQKISSAKKRNLQIVAAQRLQGERPYLIWTNCCQLFRSDRVVLRPQLLYFRGYRLFRPRCHVSMTKSKQYKIKVQNV